MSKTIREWANYLPLDIKEKFISNAIKDPDRLESIQATLNSAITGAFVWSNTTEGSDYWFNVSIMKFENIEPNKIINKYEIY